MTRATIYDVASAAGVSIKTVSRVMNNEKVKSATRDKVLTAAAALAYSPNLSARSLAGSKSYIITVLVDASLTLDHWSSGLGTDYLTRLQLGATLPCRDAGYHLMLNLIDHDAPRIRQELNRLLSALKPDGVILTPPSSDHETVLEILTRSGVPMVRLGAERALSGGLRMHLDDRGAAYAMTRALIGMGHRQIGFVMGDPRYGSSRARRDGFFAAMTEHGLQADSRWIQNGDFTIQSGLEAGREILNGAERPTAIFASNDDMALGCLTAASELGLSAPGDISIAGFDDSAAARFSRPALTTVKQPMIEMAAEAARALIEGEVAPDCDADAHFEDDMTFELILRDSTAPPR